MLLMIMINNIKFEYYHTGDTYTIYDIRVAPHHTRVSTYSEHLTRTNPSIILVESLHKVHYTIPTPTHLRSMYTPTYSSLTLKILT